MNDIEIARRLIERLGGVDAAIHALIMLRMRNIHLVIKYEKHSKKYNILRAEIARQACKA